MRPLTRAQCPITPFGPSLPRPSLPRPSARAGAYRRFLSEAEEVVGGDHSERLAIETRGELGEERRTERESLWDCGEARLGWTGSPAKYLLLSTLHAPSLHTPSPHTPPHSTTPAPTSKLPHPPFPSFSSFPPSPALPRAALLCSAEGHYKPRSGVREKTDVDGWSGGRIEESRITATF